MQRYYVDFKNCFYYLANSNPNASSIYSITENQLDKFIDDQKYVTKRVTHAKIRVKLSAALSTVDQQTGTKKLGAETIKLISRPQFLQFLVRLALQKWCVTLPKQKPKNQDKLQDKKQDEIEGENQQLEKQLKKQKIKLPMSIPDGIQRTMKSLLKYGSRLKASYWREKKYYRLQIHIVLKGYQSFLMDLFDKFSNSKFKLTKNKKLAGLLTLEQLRVIFLSTKLKRTKQSLKQVDACFIEAKRLEIQDGIMEYGLNFQQFLQCMARISEIFWFPPIADEKNPIWESQTVQKITPLFIRFQSLIVNLYRKMLDLQNNKMNKFTQKGLFAQQLQVLPEKLQQISSKMMTKTFSMIRVNSMIGENNQLGEQVTLATLIQMLKQKYKNMTVKKQVVIHEIVEVDQM